MAASTGLVSAGGETVEEGGGVPPSPSTARRIRNALRAWRRSRPFWAGVWTILGGLLMVAGPIGAFKVLFIANQALVGIVVGVVVCVFGLFLWFTPRERQLFGVFIVLASIVSFFTSDLGGFMVGMLLALIGGAMGFAWTPEVATRQAVGEQRAGEA